MKSSLEALADWIFVAPGFDLVEVRATPGNSISQRVSEEAGFT
jgi:RimJ/RimL family protein N-acetyltransferase